MITRPLKIKSAKEFQKAVDKYFKDKQEKKEPITLVGLCNALDIERQTLLEYEKEKQGAFKLMPEEERNEITDSIKRAKRLIEEQYEIRLAKQGRSGDIFALKNFNWKDKQETDLNVKGSLSLSELYNESNKDNKDND